MKGPDDRLSWAGSISLLNRPTSRSGQIMRHARSVAPPPDNVSHASIGVLANGPSDTC